MWSHPRAARWTRWVLSLSVTSIRARSSFLTKTVCDGAQGENRASAQKGSVVADALRRSGTDGPAVMVGDRRFDVAGAHENGLPAIGVLYGYGGREELENAGADYLAADLHELKQLLLQE